MWFLVGLWSECTGFIEFCVGYPQSGNFVGVLSFITQCVSENHQTNSGGEIRCSLRWAAEFGGVRRGVLFGIIGLLF